MVIFQQILNGWGESPPPQTLPSGHGGWRGRKRSGKCPFTEKNKKIKKGKGHFLDKKVFSTKKGISKTKKAFCSPPFSRKRALFYLKNAQINTFSNKRALFTEKGFYSRNQRHFQNKKAFLFTPVKGLFREKGTFLI